MRELGHKRILASEDGAQGLTVPAVNRRGRHIDVRVLGSPLRGPDDAAEGVILTMEEVDPVPDAASRADDGPVDGA